MSRIIELKEYLPTVTPFAKARAMEGVRAGDGDEASDGGVHPL